MAAGSGVLHLVGLGPEAIALQRKQLRGDVQRLQSHPGDVKLVVQRVKRRRPGAAATWRPYKGRLFPDAEHLSPTVFAGSVYATVQHALFAALWKLFAPAAFAYIEFYPDGPRRVPTAILRRPAVLHLTRVPAHEPLLLHYVSHEPSHSDLVALAAALSRKGAVWCMLCVGTLRPARARASSGTEEAPGRGRTRRMQVPQLRAILIHLPTVATAAVGDALPEGSVEHGWGLSFVPQGMEFCRQTVYPAVLPPLSTVRLCLWRRDGTHFALAETGRSPAATAAWDDDLRRFEEECDAPVAAAASAAPAAAAAAPPGGPSLA